MQIQPAREWLDVVRFIILLRTDLRRHHALLVLRAFPLPPLSETYVQVRSSDECSRRACSGELHDVGPGHGARSPGRGQPPSVQRLVTMKKVGFSTAGRLKAARARARQGQGARARVGALF